MKKLTNITKNQISQKGVQALSDRPNSSRKYGEGGLSAAQLKAWFDKLSTFLAEKINEIQDVMAADDGAEYIRVALDEVGVTNLNEFIQAFVSAKAASDFFKVYPNIAAEKPELLQTVINDLEKKLAGFSEKLKDLGYGYTAADATAVEDGGESRIDVTAENYDGGKKLVFTFCNLSGIIPRPFYRYSAYPDGTDFSEEWKPEHKYIGIAVGLEPPADKSGYSWTLYLSPTSFNELTDVPYSYMTVDEDGHLCLDGDKTVGMVGDEVPIEKGVGENSIIGNDTNNNQAIGLNSEAYGSYSNAIGEVSHSEGIGTSPMPEFADINEALEKWNTTKFHAAVGYNSRVQGKDCIALGTTAFAQGLENAAIGNRAVALGNGNTAEGNNSFACGSNNVVKGLDAGCIGQNNVVQDSRAVAFGADNIVKGSGSGTIGWGNTIANSYGYALGHNNSVAETGAGVIGCNNTVSGSSCYAFGDTNEVTGLGSGAIGQRNQISQGACFAVGRDNTLTKFSTVAIGRSNTVDHQGAQAFGFGLKSSREFQTVIGTRNKASNTALFIIGNGNNSTRSNAFEVTYTTDNGVSLKVGKTEITETQLKALLALLN